MTQERINEIKAMTFEELEDLSVSLIEDLQRASEINAERGMSAHCSGYNAYDIERYDTSGTEAEQKLVGELILSNEKYVAPTHWYVRDETEELPF